MAEGVGKGVGDMHGKKLGRMLGVGEVEKRKAVVAVDPGHGGRDPGAVCAGVREADVNLAVARVLAELLRARGYAVVMTRGEEEDGLSLEERCRVANEAGARCFVSVHCNSAGGVAAGRACGVESWHYEGSERGRRLAGMVQARLAAVTGARDRGVKASRALAVLKGTRMPAVLVECGFLTNAAERMLLGTPGYRQAVAGAIAEGVDEYLRNEGEVEGQDA